MGPPASGWLAWRVPFGVHVPLRVFSLGGGYAPPSVVSQVRGDAHSGGFVKDSKCSRECSRMCSLVAVLI